MVCWKYKIQNSFSWQNCRKFDPHLKMAENVLFY